MHWSTTLPLVGLAAASSASDASELCLKAPKPVAFRCGATGKLTRPQRAANGKLGESLVARLEECAALCEQTNQCKFFGYDGDLCETYKFTGQRMGFQKNRAYNRKYYNMACWTHDGCQASPAPSPPISPPPTEDPEAGDDTTVSPVPTPPQSNTPEPSEPALPDEEGSEPITVPTPPQSNTPEPQEPTPIEDDDEDEDIYVTPNTTPVVTRPNTPEEPAAEGQGEQACEYPSSFPGFGQTTWTSIVCGSGVGINFENAPLETYGSIVFNEDNYDGAASAIEDCAGLTQNGGHSVFDLYYVPSDPLPWKCTSFDWPGVTKEDWTPNSPPATVSVGYKLSSSTGGRGGRGGSVVSRSRLGRK